MVPIRIAWLVALLLGLPTAAIAADCVAPTPPTPVPAPSVSFVRAYHFDFVSPLRLASNANGLVYVADPRRGTVFARAADGRIVSTFDGASRPAAIAADDDGSVYLADLERGGIQHYGADWTLLREFAADLVQAGDMALDPGRQRLYVSDSEAHRVRVFSTLGDPLFEIGSRGQGDGQFEYPSGVFFDRIRDELLVADQFGYRVQVFDADGSWKFCIGGSSANPGGFFQRGRLLSAPQGLWVDEPGRIYVADSFDGQVKVVDRAGRLLTTVGRFGSGRGELRIPSDLALDGSGRLFVASANNARLEIFGIDQFSDPEQYAPARLLWTPNRVDAGSPGHFDARFDVPGYHPEQVQSASVRANGVPALAIERADRDGDSTDEWYAVFDRSAILATLPPAGRVEVTLSGTLGETALHATAELEIVPVQLPDADGDGIEDSVDACLASQPGATVDTRGCSIAQYCDCGSATRHGRHQRCVARVSRQFVKAGLIERSERRQLLRAAARADCGQDLHHAHSHDAEDRDRADEDDRYTREHERKRRRDEHPGDDDDREHARGKHARGWLNAPGGSDR